jgi:hypothetical protein
VNEQPGNEWICMDVPWRRRTGAPVLGTLRANSRRSWNDVNCAAPARAREVHLARERSDGERVAIVASPGRRMREVCAVATTRTQSGGR